MKTISIDSNMYKGAEMYAKLHNISVERLVEKFLLTFQKPSSEIKTVAEESDEFLDALDEDLMKQTFEAAHQDYLAGRCKTHKQVMAEMKAKYAWR